MHILLIHQAYYPEMSGTARRTKELAESFVKMGHIVSVLTSTPREYRSFPDYRFKLFEMVNGVHVYRIKTLFEIKRNVLFRMLSYFSFFVQSLFIAIKLSNKADIIISIAPLSSGLIGAVCQKITKKHHHFDVPDMLPDLGIAAGMLKNKLLIKLLYKVEKWVYNNSKSISGCTLGHVNAIKNKNIHNKNVHWIPDWIDDKYFINNNKLYSSEVRNIYNYPDKKLISFVGNIGVLQKPDTFVEVMRLLEKEDNNEYLFLFIGDGIMLPELKILVNKYQIKNIEFIGKVKREYIPSLMKLSNVLVTNYVPNKHLDLYIPGKLFEYAFSERPIVMGSNGDAKDFVEKYKLGVAVTPSDANSFKEAIIKVSNENYKFEPDKINFSIDYSIDNVVKLYNKIFSKIKL